MEQLSTVLHPPQRPRRTLSLFNGLVRLPPLFSAYLPHTVESEHVVLSVTLPNDRGHTRSDSHCRRIRSFDQDPLWNNGTRRRTRCVERRLGGILAECPTRLCWWCCWEACVLKCSIVIFYWLCRRCKEAVSGRMNMLTGACTQKDMSTCRSYSDNYMHHISVK